MKVAVFDTYVRKSNGDTTHFDIIVPEGRHDEHEILTFGKKYLSNIDEQNAVISTKECQFCHIENPSQKVLDHIGQKGYYILELGDIPANLPGNPSRRDLILHIRAHFENLRFENFKDYSIEKLKSTIG